MSNFADSFDRTPVGKNFAAAFDAAVAAETPNPLPQAQYTAKATRGELGTTRNGVPFYAIHFEIVSGEYAGRRLVKKWYMSDKARPYAKRDLAALGLTSGAQCERGEVPDVPLTVNVALRQSEAGNAYNEVEGVFPCKNAPAAAAQTATPKPQESPAALADPTPVAAVSASSPPPMNAPPVTPADLSAGLVDPNLI